jgi:6-phosphogluconolactonase
VAELRITRADEPVQAAAFLLVAALDEVDRTKGFARLAIPGGTAARAMGAARALLPGSVWRRLRMTWADERCVDFDDPDSNRGAAYRAGWLDPQDSPGLELPLFLDGETPRSALERARAGLRGRFQGAIDVALLGLGEDGHIASLFPGQVAREALDLATLVTDSPKPPALRISLTQAILAKASGIVLLATGETKRRALMRVARHDPTLPTAALTNLTVVTDLELEP